MKLPRRQFLHLAAGAAVLPALSGTALALDYPTRPVRFVVGFPGGRDRHCRTPDCSIAVGAARAAGYRRQSAGCGQQYCCRGGR